MITEFGLSGRLAGGNSKFRSFDNFPLSAAYSSWELGLMRNVSARQAVGFEMFAGIEWRDIGTGLGWGLKPRYRYWINRDLAFDLSSGLLLSATEETFKPPGFTGSASLGLKDLVIFTTSLEIARFEGFDYRYSAQFFKEDRVSWYLGAKAGAGLGAITGSVGALAVVAGVIIILATLQD